MQNFLNTVQSKLEALEREAGELEQDFKDDQKQLLEIAEINQKAERDLHDYRVERKIGKLEREISEALEKPEHPYLIDPVMTAGQINQQLSSLYEANDRLLNEIEALTPQQENTSQKVIGTLSGFRKPSKTDGTAKKKSRSKSKGKKLTSTLASTVKHALRQPE